MPPHSPKPTRQRIDRLLVERGLAVSLVKARALLMAGQVTVGGSRIDKAGALVDATADIRLAPPPPYVGRGGVKLAHALQEFGLDLTGSVALDVGYGQIHQRLRDDPRVEVLERVNARNPFHLQGPVDL
ncbi:MAG: S4 domain-containing protein, partial [Chloroflexi bacterium]|nr:S4 domain-containing protein [Chloroflexota bacterium]